MIQVHVRSVVARGLAWGALRAGLLAGLSSLCITALTSAGCDPTPPAETAVVYKDIQTDMKTKCSTNLGACHSAAAANNFKVDETAGKESDNYTKLLATSGLVNKAAAATSTILTVPLMGAGGEKHTGGVKFVSTNDATYQKWLKWIQAGAPEKTQ